MAWMWRWSSSIREEEHREHGKVVSWETLRRWRIKWLDNVISHGSRHMRSQDDLEMKEDVANARRGLHYVKAKYGDKEDEVIVQYVAAQEAIIKKAERLTCVLCQRLALVPMA